VICSHCGAANAAEQKYCDECGLPLAESCPACGAGHRPGAKFCGECGAPLGGAEQPRSDSADSGSPVGERRLVSVLFADLVGFTGASEGEDPEDVRELLGRYFETAREIVERYGGVVEKFIGDAVMAVWGTPIAYEDDAERAVRAALDLVDGVRALGAGIEARVGVLTGEAAVTLGAQGQGMVAGDLVNTASRLQGAAAPGTVLVGDATMNAAARAIAFEPAGEHTFRGKTSPTPAYRALRVVAHVGGGGRSEMLEAPFVGRDEELRVLKELLHVSGRDPRTRLVSITGVGGIGKSRLAWELEKYVDGVRESVYWHRGRSPAYGEGITFWALGEMVRGRCKLAETDDESSTRARIAETVAEYVADPDDRRWIEPALLALLGLDPPPPGGRDALFSAWRMFFEAIAERGTTVLIFEDLQWADSGLLDFIEHVLEWSRGAPLLLITLSRPELFDRRPDWGAGTRNFTALALDALSEDTMRELLSGLVPGLPSDAANAIVERADGVPLYAVEMVRMLVGEGRLEQVEGAYRPVGELGELSIPNTLRSLIASRLDSLDAPDRALLQDASVLGQSFTPSGLASVAGLPEDEVTSRLRSLVRRELIRMELDPRSPERGQYAFVQALIREVAYGTLARADRRSRHLAAARFLESLGEDELAGAVATHYLDAHRLSAEGPDAEEIAEKARAALTSAADRAASLGAHDQAITYLELVMSITTEPSDRANLLDDAAVEADAAGQYAASEQYAREAIALFGASGERAGFARATTHLGQTLINAGQAERAIEVFDSALKGTDESGTDLDEARARLLAGLAHACQRHAQYERGLSAADEALVLAERLALDDVIASAMVTKATVLGRLGRPRESTALVEGGLRLAQKNGQIKLELRARNNLAAALSTDDFRQPGEIMRGGLELAEKVGDRQMALWLTSAVSTYDFVAGRDWDAILALIDRHLERDLDPFDRINLGQSRLWILAEQGKPVDAELAELDALLAGASDTQLRAGLEMARAVIELAQERYEDAFDTAMRAIQIEPGFVGIAGDLACQAAIGLRDVERLRTVDAQRARVARVGRLIELESMELEAAVAALEGRTTDAVRTYRELLRHWREMEQFFFVARDGLNFVTLVGPEEPEARAAGEEARTIFARLGAEPALARLDALLDEAAPASTAAPSRT
jgi:class 3 adenylate cyclase/tetratricopeptide (TPR) repeat protein